MIKHPCILDGSKAINSCRSPGICKENTVTSHFTSIPPGMMEEWVRAASKTYISPGFCVENTKNNFCSG